NGWTSDRAKEIAETAWLARRAAELGPDDAVALSRAAHAIAFGAADIAAGTTFVDRALVLNPNLAGAWYASGWIRVWRGEPDIAIDHFAHGMRLSPLDPNIIECRVGRLSLISSGAATMKHRLGPKKLCGSKRII